MKAHFWTLLVIVLLYAVAELASNVFAAEPAPGAPGPPGPTGMLAGLGLFYTVLVMWPLLVGVASAFLKAVRGRDPELDDMLDGFRTYVNAVGGMLVYTVLVIVGLILLIVPGVVALVRLVFTPFLIVDRGLDPIQAVKASWEETRGYGWSLFGLLLVNLVIMVVGLLLLIVGVFVAMVWVWASVASYYHAVLDDPSRTDPVGHLGSGPPATG